MLEEAAAVGGRRLEAAVLRDRSGQLLLAGVTEVTVRYRDCRLLVECPVPGLSRAAEEEIEALATRAVSSGFGPFTVALELASSGGARVSAVHTGLPRGVAPIEAVTELDLAALARSVAGGELLTALLPEGRGERRGHALQTCLAAFDPERQLVPAPGEIELLRVPGGPGVRGDVVVDEGQTVDERSGLAIVRLTAHGHHRAEALARLRAAVAATLVSVCGGACDKALVTAVLDRPEIAAGPVDGSWLGARIAAGEHLPQRLAEVALVQAAIADYEEALAGARRRFFASATRGRPEAPAEIGRSVELRHRGASHLFRVERLDRRRFRLTIDGHSILAEVSAASRLGQSLRLGEQTHRTFVGRGPHGLLVEVDGVPHAVAHAAGTVVRAPAPAIVVSVAVAAGDEVATGGRLAVLEAMKVESEVVAPSPGRVRSILARRNMQVAGGAPLFVLDPLGSDGLAAVGTALDFAALAARSATAAHQLPRWRRELDEIRGLVLGYDVEADAVRHGLVEVPHEDRDLARRLEEEILHIYVDIAALFRRRPAEEEMEDDGRRTVEEYLFTYLRDLDAAGSGLPPAFLDTLQRALAHYGAPSLARSPWLEESLFRIATAQRRRSEQAPALLALLERLRLQTTSGTDSLRELLDRLIEATREREPAVYDLAREVRYRIFDQPFVAAARCAALAAAQADLAELAGTPAEARRTTLVRSLVECPQPIHTLLSERACTADPALLVSLLEVMVRRHYRIRPLATVVPRESRGRIVVTGEYEHRGSSVSLLAAHARSTERIALLATMGELAAEQAGRGRELVADLFLWQDGELGGDEEAATELRAEIQAAGLPADLLRVAVSRSGPGDQRRELTFRRDEKGHFAEDRLVRGLHPMVAERLHFWRLANFDLERLPSAPEVHLFRGVARANPRDERLFALCEVRDLTPARDALGRVVRLPQLEHVFLEGLAAMRAVQSQRPLAERLQWNRLGLFLWPRITLAAAELSGLVDRLAPLTEGLGLEKVVIRARFPGPRSEELQDWMLEIARPGDGARTVRLRRPSERPLEPLDDYDQKVLELRRRGLFHPFEVVRLLAPNEDGTAIPRGEFVELDLDAANRLTEVKRTPGKNSANVVVGLIRNFTERYPEGMARVILLGDAGRGMGALAEPECRRIIAALDLAAERGLPLEWIALSAGAKIAMDSGTENMDWISKVLRRIIEFTQGGGEINVIVPGINVGAQPYWNAEATMLMHTKGVLIMTPDGAMVLTGKQALDYSGGVSAEDNQGIGGYERIMGPNGQAQYFARDLGEACRILLAHYEHAWVAPGERFPRRASTADPHHRDVCASPHGGEFATVGEVFADATNPGRKRPFDIRRVMRAVSDSDHEPLERWFGMRDAEIGVVWDATIGGYPVTLLGFESRPLQRLGWVPVYGPDQWTGGTLFPQSSKKIARAINAASNSRPLVVIANLSGFDGSPESMRDGQLEFGAEIGRAVVNFRGPIVFVVVSRYHGGAFVVFSSALHDNMQVAALAGTYASVIGGAPAAAVVFAREVERRTRTDARVAELEQALADPQRGDKPRLRAELAEARELVRSEKLGEVAEEFDRIHSIERAQRYGSVHEIIPPEQLRPWVIAALERGMAREIGGDASPAS